MTRVRPFQKHDIPQVVALRPQRFRSSEHADDTALAAYVAEVFFGNPWYDESLPSLVAEDGHHRIVGFLGVVPRRMISYGVPRQVATTTQFMVAPTAPPPVASQLLRALFDGPQQLSLADVASPASRRLWESLGGVTATASSLTWTRFLRPLGHVMGSVGGRRMLAHAGTLLARPLDALATRLLPACRRPPVPTYGQRRPMSEAELAGHFAKNLDGRGVRGDYDAPSLAWLFDMLARKRQYGPLHKAQILDERGGLLGWYVYCAYPGGHARVAHVGARARTAGIVLDHLCHDAWVADCTAVSGRFDSRLIDALVERRCLIYGTDTWVVVHSRDRGLLSAVARDEVALTRLDAEWWMAF